jgi:DNA topoisomerase-3
VLDIAQALYETHKATTYPRTDCGYLPTSMRGEIGQVMASIQQSDPALSAIVLRLDVQYVSRIWNDKKITAHHGIIPTKQPCDMAKMSEQERNVYQLIRLHYLAQFLPNHEVDATRVSLSCGGSYSRPAARLWSLLAGKACLVRTLKRMQAMPLTRPDYLQWLKGAYARSLVRRRRRSRQNHRSTIQKGR